MNRTYFLKFQIIQAIGVHVQDYVPAIIQCLLKTLKDDDEEVRSNSTFAFGVLAESGGDAVTGYVYPKAVGQCCSRNYLLLKLTGNHQQWSRYSVKQQVYRLGALLKQTSSQLFY